ncbi:hypothetical protein D9M71_727330 [compost metagenome]
MAVHVRFLDQRGENVFLGLISEDFVDGLDGVFEARKPHGVERGDVEGNVAGREFTGEPDEHAVVRQFHKVDVDSGVLLALFGNAGEFGVTAGFHQDVDGACGATRRWCRAPCAASGSRECDGGADAAKGDEPGDGVSSGHRCRLTFSRTGWQDCLG